MSRPVVQLDDVTRRYRVGRGEVVGGVRDVSLAVGPGERVGLVGASGAGKSTIAGLVTGLLAPDRGVVQRAGGPGGVHLVAQDPYGALAPHATVGWTVAEPLRLASRRDGLDAAVRTALEEVGLTPAARFVERYPHELSGGELQRVALARAVVARPALVVADEPTQMVDVLARAELLDLMLRMARDHDTAWLYVTHDLGVARAFCERLVVLDDGCVVESGPTTRVLAEPASHAARRLVRAMGVLGR